MLRKLVKASIYKPRKYYGEFNMVVNADIMQSAIAAHKSHNRIILLWLFRCIKDFPVQFICVTMRNKLISENFYWRDS